MHPPRLRRTVAPVYDPGVRWNRPPAAFLFLAAAVPAVPAVPAAEVRVAGPSGGVVFRLLIEEGRARWEASFRGKPVIEPSALAFTLDGVDITEGIAPGEIERYRRREEFPGRGVRSKRADRCEGAKIPLRRAGRGPEHVLEVRVFDDAVAFRHVLPAGVGDLRTPDESTAFVLPEGTTVWLHDLEGHYEGVHQRKAIAVLKDGEWAAPPVTFQLPGGAGFGSITEAALSGYAGMALRADGPRRFRLVLGHAHPPSYPFRLRYGAEEAERLSKPAAISGTISTPWRVVIVAADLNGLVNCDAVPALSPPPDLRLFPEGLRTAWIRPGRAVWKYLDGGASTIEGMKEFCRLAGELGFEHAIVEGFWRRWSESDLRDLVEEGRKRGVGIWLWKHSKELREAEARRAFFGMCRSVGAAGVKIDFLDHEAKEVIDHYQVLLAEAAEHRLMVNFHGSNKPAGEERTWPNELVRESVRGMESSRLRDRARHDATLPFTRFLAGPADYTPVHFGARRADTTWAHQAASAVVFTAPLLTYGAHPRNILENPCAPLLKSVPSVWDETVVLPASAIGEVAAFARRSGEAWFLGILSGPEARSLRVPLSFLASGDYAALIVRDRPDDPAAVKVEEPAARREDILQANLSAGGGLAARFTRK